MKQKNMYRLRLRPRQRQKPRLNLGLLTLALDLEKIRSNELRGTVNFSVSLPSGMFRKPICAETHGFT